MTFEADSLLLDLTDLAERSHPFLNIHGDLTFECDSFEDSQPVTFMTDWAYLKLPTWDATRSGSISFKFRTNEQNGLLMYNSGATTAPTPDFFAFELMEGHVYMIMNLGSGVTKVKATNR